MNDLVRLPHVFEERNWKKNAATGGAALLLLAVGWGAGAKIDALRGPSPEQFSRTVAENAEKADQSRKQEIADLRAHVETLKGRLEAQADKARESDAAVAALQKSLVEEKNQSQALNARLEKLQRVKEAAKPTPQAQAQAPAQAPQPQTLGRAADQGPTSTIPKATSPKTPVLGPTAVTLKPVAPTPHKYGAFVLRDVSDGLAMVEGEDGVEEVAPGDILPGGARVQRIERRGRGWIVMTDRGYIAPSGRWAD